MAGLYFHIPWCRRVCSYCNFHFSTNTKDLEPLTAALIQDLAINHGFIQTTVLESLYFGGGTPSMIPVAGIEALLKTAAKYYSWAPDAEITLEANPEDINPEKLQLWKAAGINRLSIGVQSLSEEDLRFMNRGHNAVEAKNCVQMALDAGFGSVSIDLIFGSPWLTHEDWEKTLDWAFNCGADHISPYGLTIEPKTFLQKKIKKGEWPAPEEEAQAMQYTTLYDRSITEGWDFYETSNMSKPGKRAVHNSNYWQNKPYLGIGPSAHSYAGNTRRWNVSDNKQYANCILQGIPAWDSEELDAANVYNEYVLTNLRRSEGVSLTHMAKAGFYTNEELHDFANNLENKGLAKIDSNQVKLTLQGRLLADWISSEWMV